MKGLIFLLILEFTTPCALPKLYLDGIIAITTTWVESECSLMIPLWILILTSIYFTNVNSTL